MLGFIFLIWLKIASKNEERYMAGEEYNENLLRASTRFGKWFLGKD